MKLKQKTTLLLVAIGLFVGFGYILYPPTVSAQIGAEEPAACVGDECPEEQAGGEEACEEVETSIIKVDSCAEEGGAVFELLKMVLRILTAGVGVAAVGGIAYGALLYTTAENKPDQTKRAVGIITNVIIGLAAYALMFLLLNFLIPGGVFS